MRVLSLHSLMVTVGTQLPCPVIQASASLYVTSLPRTGDPSPPVAFRVPQVYSSSEFLAVQPTPTFAERSYSEDREEAWDHSSEGDGGHRLSTEVR